MRAERENRRRDMKPEREGMISDAELETILLVGYGYRFERTHKCIS